VLAVLFLITMPVTVSAGMLSFVASLFTDKGADSAPLKESATYNSQTIPLLAAALHVDPNPAKGGGDVTVVDDALLSETGPDGTLADIEDAPPTSDQISLYVVREGDALSQIAEMFNVSVNTIRWANEIGRGESIQPGETLVILPISGVRHTVEEGDTLKGIAEKYEGDIEEVLDYNQLDKDAVIAVGDTIVVPGGEISGGSGDSSGATVFTQATPTRSVDGYYTHPLPGSLRTQGLHGYNGVDFGAPYGTSIVAAASGEVIISRNGGWNGGYGNYIVIRHSNGTQTLYAHNSQNIVYGGQQVVAGQVIAYVGATGRATGAHLHFEVRGARNPF